MSEKKQAILKLFFAIVFFLLGCLGTYLTFEMKNLVNYGNVETDFKSEVTTWGDHPINIAGAGAGGGVDSSNDGVAIGLGIFSDLSIMSSAILLSQLKQAEDTLTKKTAGLKKRIERETNEGEGNSQKGGDKMVRKQAKISRLILNYLRKNPDAGDTLEGITKWWLGLEKIDLAVNEVSNILESLTQKGLIRKYRTKGSTTFYKAGEEEKSQKSKPGVYVEEVPCSVRTIEGVDTSTAAFIGLAEKGDLDKAVLVTNFSEFEEKYGSFYVKSDGTIHSYLAYSVFQFFNNGGRRCYVVRVAHGTLDDYMAGFSMLNTVRDVSIIAVPGIGSKEIVDFGSTYCEKRSTLAGVNDCFFIGEMSVIDDTVEEAQIFVNHLTKKSPYTAVYFPWLTMVDPIGILPEPIRVPPAGFIAGMYAKIDGKFGVWKAPAGTEANIGGATGLLKNVTDAEQDSLNNKGINCIRAFPASGLVIWGSRTLSTLSQPEWRYVPVRRMAIFLEVSIFNGIQWAVFEPNDEELWASLRLNIGSFMMRLFREGAFQGDTPSKAFFVKCDPETTTQADIDAGVVNALVGFAPLKPAEFVVIKISQKAGQAVA